MTDMLLDPLRMFDAIPSQASHGPYPLPCSEYFGLKLSSASWEER